MVTVRQGKSDNKNANAWVVKYRFNGDLMMYVAYDSVELQTELETYHKANDNGNAYGLQVFLFDGKTGEMREVKL